MVPAKLKELKRQFSSSHHFFRFFFFHLLFQFTSPLLLLDPANAALTPADPKVIYGRDDRKDYYEFTKAQKEIANSILALIETSKLHLDARRGQYLVSPPSLSTAEKLCHGARFGHQPVLAKCTGFLVAPNIVATAGHCMLTENDCAQFSWVKNYYTYGPIQQRFRKHKFAQNEVYQCEKILITHRDYMTGSDFALVQLKSEVVNSKPLPLASALQSRIGDPISSYGFPTGIPMKIIEKGSIRDLPLGRPFLVSNLDTFQGNSGSPIFNQAQQVIGLLVRGDKDFVWREDGKCKLVHTCQDNECSGEEATYIDEILPYLPTHP
jgi:V8-like Glu-specific endopeptidase